MSPDWNKYPEAVPYASLSDPQTLNLYAYLSNNPLKSRDIDGHHQECAPKTWAKNAAGDAMVLTAGACHEVPDWWQFQGARNWLHNHPKIVKYGMRTVEAVTVISSITDEGASLLAVPEEELLEESLLEGVEVAAETGEAGEAAAGAGEAAKAAEAASEKTANAMARQIQKDIGKDARRAFHDEKMHGGGDRTLQELKNDARAIYDEAGKTPPSWMR